MALRARPALASVLLLTTLLAGCASAPPAVNLKVAPGPALRIESVPNGGASVATAAIPVSQEATLTVLTGEVVLVRGGTPTSIRDAKAQVRAGDRLSSGLDANAVLSLFDGSSMTIEGGTVIEVDTLDRVGEDKVVQFTQFVGRTWNAVTKLFSANSRYDIRTPGVTASVRGTAFAVGVSEDVRDSFLTTVEGSVAVRDGTQSILVPAGTRFATRVGNSGGSGFAPPPERNVGFSSSGVFTISDSIGRRAGVEATGKVVLEIPGAQVARSSEGKLHVVLPAVDASSMRAQATSQIVQVSLIDMLTGTPVLLHTSSVDASGPRGGALPGVLLAAITEPEDLAGLYGVGVPKNLLKSFADKSTFLPFVEKVDSKTAKPSAKPDASPVSSVPAFKSFHVGRSVPVGNCSIAGCIDSRGVVGPVDCTTGCGTLNPVPNTSSPSLAPSLSPFNACSNCNGNFNPTSPRPSSAPAQTPRPLPTAASAPPRTKPAPLSTPKLSTPAPATAPPRLSTPKPEPVPTKSPTPSSTSSPKPSATVAPSSTPTPSATSTTGANLPTTGP